MQPQELEGPRQTAARRDGKRQAPCIVKQPLHLHGCPCCSMQWNLILTEENVLLQVAAAPGVGWEVLAVFVWREVGWSLCCGSLARDVLGIHDSV